MGQFGVMGWAMVTVGVVLVVLGLVMGGATWGTTILISVFGFVLVAVGALMAMRARRASAETDAASPATEASSPATEAASPASSSDQPDA